MKKSHLILSCFLLSIIVLTGCKKEPGNSPEKTGMVYIMDNETDANHVLSFSREADGSLYPAGKFATGGKGTGSGLGSQGALIMKGKYVYACNAGSDEITAFIQTDEGLKWVDKISSNGATPVSVTVHNDLLYVLNVGKINNISGFRIRNNGRLAPIPNSYRELSAAMAGGGQIAFNSNGTQLVVTEKNTNKISTYPVYSNGLPGPGVAHPSAGMTPFGFDFAKNDVLVVSEAFGGEPGLSTVSSYKLSNTGNVSLITGPVPTRQTAACWVVVTTDGRFAYATNAQSASVTGYKIGNAGALSLLDANGITAATGANPNDLSFSANSEYLYTLNRGANSISCFKVNKNGGLTSIGEVTDIPDQSAGMTAN